MSIGRSARLVTLGIAPPKASCVGRALLCLMPLLAVSLLGGCKEKNSFVAPPPPRVGVAQPLRHLVTPWLEVTGTVAATNSVDLVARVQGMLTSIDYTDGAVARKGDTLFTIEPAPYEAKYQQAQATLAATQAQLTQAEAEFNRQASLGRSDFASQSSVDQARSNRDVLRANVTNEQAGVTLAAINLGYTRVTAPFDGVVTAHLFSAGELVGATSPTKLAEIMQLDPIYVNFTLSEQDVARIRAGLARRGLTVRDLPKVPVEVGLPSENGFPHQGTLDYVEPQVDPATGTLALRGVLANPDRGLLAGNFVRVRIPADQQRPMLLIPDVALGADQTGRYALIVNQDDVVEQRSVQTGQSVGRLRAIESGLAPEDRVVIEGVQRAVVGSKVAPQQAQIALEAKTAALARQ